jgi:hypothetical protein
VLCGCEDDPKRTKARGKYKRMFGRNELKLTTIDSLGQAPADYASLAAQVIKAKGGYVDGELCATGLSECVKLTIGRRFGVCGAGLRTRRVRVEAGRV